MKPSGTKIQFKLRNQVKRIPKEKTVYYKCIVKRICKPNAYRAVANACLKNFSPIKVSCHRVIKKNGKTYGYFNKKNSVIKRLTFKKKL
tara:strand:+ start:720 stop:986 length:267 start_codon:yes stop_codon:yes gene_type:complete